MRALKDYGALLFATAMLEGNDGYVCR
jgi:hypothetical protein